MKTYNQTKESIENELIQFAGLIKKATEANCITSETFEKCKGYADSLNIEIQSLNEGKELFTKCIESISKDNYKQVIKERLLHNKKWDDVAAAVGYTKKHIQTSIYPVALKEFEVHLQCTHS